MTGAMLGFYLLSRQLLLCLGGVLTIAVVAVLNRAAGGGFVSHPAREDGDWLLKPLLPGRPVYWIAPAIGLISWPWLGWQEAAALAFSYLVWRLPPWGRWYTMDRQPIGWGRKGIPPSRYEQAIEAISFGSGRLAMFWRFLSTSPAIAPLAWLVEPSTANVAAFMLGSAAALWLAYEAGWQGYDRKLWGGGIPAAELLSGALWGSLIVFAGRHHPIITGGGF